MTTPTPEPGNKPFAPNEAVIGVTREEPEIAPAPLDDASSSSEESPDDVEDELPIEPGTLKLTKRPTRKDLDELLKPPKVQGPIAYDNYTTRLDHARLLMKKHKMGGYVSKRGYVKGPELEGSSGEVKESVMVQRLEAAKLLMKQKKFKSADVALKKHERKLRKYGWSGSTWNRSAMPGLSVKDYKLAETRLLLEMAKVR
jgi:hypothetical protein